MAVVDTNHSPEGLDYVIPGNDDSSRAIRLYALVALQMRCWLVATRWCRKSWRPAATSSSRSKSTGLKAKPGRRDFFGLPTKI